MPWCPKCNAEYVDGVTVCADCGIELVSEPPKREAHQAMRKVHDVVVYATSDPYDARIVQSLLRASGIPSLLRNGLEVIGLPSERYAITVPASFAKRAHELLESAQEGSEGEESEAPDEE